MSEQILLLNPRGKRRRKHNRRTRSRRRRTNRRRGLPAGLRKWMASHRRRRRTNRKGRHYMRRRRTNRRHYGRRRRTNRRYYARRHNRRSISLKGMSRGIVGQYVMPAVIGGAGALTLDVAWGYLSPKLPAQLQTGWFGLAAKSALVIGGVALAGRFLPRQRRALHVGGLGAVTVLVANALKGVAQSVLPATTPGLSGYVDYQAYALPGTRLNGYMSRPGLLGDLGDWFSPAAVIQPLGQPVPQQFGGYQPRPTPFSGYVAVQPHVGGGGGLMGYDWQNDGM